MPRSPGLFLRYINMKSANADIEALSVNVLREESDLVALQEVEPKNRTVRSLHSLQTTSTQLSNWDDIQHKSMPKLTPQPEAHIRVVIRPKSAKESQRKMGFSWFSFRSTKSPSAVDNLSKQGSIKAFLKAKSGLNVRNRPQTGQKQTSNCPSAAEWLQPPREVFSYLVKLRTSLRQKSPKTPRRGSKEKFSIRDLVSFAKLDFQPLSANTKSKDSFSPFRGTRESEGLSGKRKKGRAVVLQRDLLIS